MNGLYETLLSSVSIFILYDKSAYNRKFIFAKLDFVNKTLCASEENTIVSG